MNHSLRGRGEGEETIADLCLLVARLYQENNMNGELLARLTSRLIAAEVQPGGPYFGPNNTPDFFTNLAIGYLFTIFKKPLPKVAAFIEANRHKSSHSPHISALLKKYDALSTPSSVRSKNIALHTAIFRTAKQNLRLLSQPEKDTALHFLDIVRQADKNQEIALLPSLFARSLLSPPAQLPLHELGLANVYCWIAYTIYDQILDETPNPELLPVANIAMRKSLQVYQQLFPVDHAFHTILDKTFTSMDHANAWEIARARFQRTGKYITLSKLPAYEQYDILADRCSGHILGPLAISILCDVSTEALNNVEKGLRHYLIARQLSDDIHDWKDDFTAGHASSVSTHILTQLGVTSGKTAFTPLLTAMRTNFWEESMESFTAIIVRHLEQSRHYLLQSGLLMQQGPIFALHDQLKKYAEDSLSEYRASHEFLNAYSTANGSHQSHRSLRQ